MSARPGPRGGYQVTGIPTAIQLRIAGEVAIWTFVNRVLALTFTFDGRWKALLRGGVCGDMGVGNEKGFARGQRPDSHIKTTEAR
jgi:predicted lysophospholipase L1 biosynthesis ABC-type transport system permease subunit